MVACVISKNKKKKDNGDMGLINKSQIQSKGRESSPTRIPKQRKHEDNEI